MKKILLLFLTLFMLSSCEQELEIIDVDAEKQTKIEVCHYDAETHSWITISIAEKALEAHLGHGDKIGGKCGYTYIPDDAFEWYLIYYGHDDVMDDYVLTANIEGIETLLFDDWCCTSPWVDYPYGQGPWDIPSVEDLTGLEDFKSLKSFTIIGEHFFTLYNLDLYKVPHLEILNVYSVGIVEMDLSQNIALRELTIRETGVSFDVLDLSQNSNLESIWIEGVNITGLNIQNGANALITFFEASNNYPGIDCIQVDNVAYSIANWGANYNFSDNCGF